MLAPASRRESNQDKDRTPLHGRNGYIAIIAGIVLKFELSLRLHYPLVLLIILIVPHSQHDFSIILLRFRCVGDPLNRIPRAGCSH